MNVLLTGGAGYIGSHTAIALHEAGHTPIIADSFVNSSPEAIKRVESIIGQEVVNYELDIRDRVGLNKIFEEHEIDAVIHFAGLKAVGESVAQPLKYYQVNLESTLTLLESMKQHQVNKLIFSSSATVYGTPESLPLTEESPVGIGLTNPYGKTKYMIEEILRDIVASDEEANFTILRYFNPVGAHPSGLIGEDPQGIPNNLLPFVSQVAVGKHDSVKVFGNDYDTPDGTGVRDYIHVLDLAEGHVAALKNDHPGEHIYNLGTGRGSSVLELIEYFRQASGREIGYGIQERRPGDVASCYASPDKAKRELGWSANRTLLEACEDSWRWQSQNPNGYN